MSETQPTQPNAPDLPPLPEGADKGLVAWFARNHVAANILMIFFIVAGIASVMTMNREIFPTIDPRIIQVSVPYPGASPEDIEESITKRVEEGVVGIQGVQRVNSTAREGVGLIQIELEDFVDAQEVLTEIETEVDRLNDFPPENAEQVTIVRLKPEQDVISLVVYGDVPVITLREWAEHIRDDLLRSDEISLVDLSGTLEREISIEVSEKMLQKHQLTLRDIAQQIEAFSIDLPAGTMRAKGSEILLRVQERRDFGYDFDNIPIISTETGARLLLSHIATIKDNFENTELRNDYNGQPAIFIDIKRSQGQDTLTVESAVQDFLETLELPDQINLSIRKNRTISLKERINLLVRNALMGLALVFISMILLLDLKLAFWTTIGIAISFLGGLFLAPLFGITINMISLFALIVVLGIVVDDAIVAGESIFNEQERGRKGLDSALYGVTAVQTPVTIGVLTTIAAFIPLAFSTGVLGQILRPIPIVVTCVLALSLLEAFFILPAHMSSSKKWSIGPLAKIRDITSAGLEWIIDKIVLPVAHICISARYLTLFIAVTLVFIPIYALSSGMIGFIFFPNIESDEITVTLEMPEGTSFETTEKYVLQIMDEGEKIFSQYKTFSGNPLIENISLTVGATARDSGGPTGGTGSTISSHLGEITVELVPSKDRSSSANEITRLWRNAVSDIPLAQKIAFKSSLIHGGADISLELSHRDSAILDQASEELKAEMKDINGLSEVVDSLEDGKKEFVFSLTPEGLASGLTPASLGSQLRTIFYGFEVDRLQRGSSEVKVMVRYPREERDRLDVLERMRLDLPDGERGNISRMTQIHEQYRPATITRVDGHRVVSITANADEAVITPDKALSQITDILIPDLMDKYPGLSYEISGQSKDQKDDLATLFNNLGIAVMVIFVLLASQLHSYSQPFIIICTIPLGIAGAIYGHMVMGFDLTFVSLFGVVALSGVVINDSVVLVDYYNKKLDQGYNAYQASIIAIKRRFRPILLTTMTTSLGLLPILLETSLQARFIIPMALSLAGGILFASVLLIFSVPALLVIFDDLKMLGEKMSGYKTK